MTTPPYPTRRSTARGSTHHRRRGCRRTSRQGSDIEDSFKAAIDTAKAADDINTEVVCPILRVFDPILATKAADRTTGEARCINAMLMAANAIANAQKVHRNRRPAVLIGGALATWIEWHRPGAIVDLLDRGGPTGDPVGLGYSPYAG